MAAMAVRANGFEEPAAAVELRSSAAIFALPPELEAHEPIEARGGTRDSVRLLVTRGTEGRAQHASFRQLPYFFSPGDVLVLNVSATVPAALKARSADDVAYPLHVSTGLPGGIWIVEPRDYAPRAGETAALPADATVTYLSPYRDSHRLWLARLDGVRTLSRYLGEHGAPITYRHVHGQWPLQMYQTAYATAPGSAEMPSAGRPFTAEVLDRLRAFGVDIARVVLHAGVSSLERDEPPHEEYFEVPPETAALIGKARAKGTRVIGVGTTSVRALESATDNHGDVVAARGWTDLVIAPERSIASVDGMLTGFHEPQSSHLAILQALVGPIHVASAYEQALAGRYLWHAFGDSHLLLRK